MSLTIRSNQSAMFATHNLSKTQSNLTSSLEKISSGLRINRAADDAAGLGVVVRMENTNTSLQQAMRNTNDGISFVQTAEGSIEQLSNILIRFRELSVQAANETYTTTDRTMIQTEMAQLKNEYNRITSTANFNEQDLLEATIALSIQVGIDGATSNRISFTLSNFATTAGAIGGGLSVVFGQIANAANVTVAQANLARLDSAVNALSTRRAKLGAIQNRFENALAEASTYSQNLSAAQSQILDVDYATESANMTRFQIQQQAGVAALAQAKAIPQSVISLLS